MKLTEIYTLMVLPDVKQLKVYLISILPTLIKNNTHKHLANHWENHLNSLTIQNKNLDIVTLNVLYGG